jgi:5-methyltetrahydrofolate--homocysteine methyltransferase
MMSKLLEALESRVLVVDGAMGTEMFKLGLGVGESGELWNIDQPDKIVQIQKAYADAGADILISNTFGANRIALEKHKLADRAKELIEAGVGLAKEAAGDSRFVLGDIGPTGEFMEPLGVYTREEFVGIFREQAGILAEAGVDGFIIETMTDLNEIKAAIEACEGHGLPVIASMSFNVDADGSGFHTMMGVSPKDMAQALKDTGVVAIGANCGSADALEMVRVVEEIKSVCALPVMIEANAGKPRNVDGRTVYDQTPGEMANAVPALVKAGARIIGGCCGTTPDHIQAVRNKLNQL